MNVLGVSIGTTRTGVCVLNEERLIDWQIHNFHAVWSDHKMKVILNRYKRYIVKYKINAVMVKIPPLRKHTKALTSLIGRIELLAHEYDCQFDLITKQEIKYITNIRNTNSLIEFVRVLYPKLLAVYERGLENNHRYYKKLYEAVLAAHIYLERQRSRDMQIERQKNSE